MQCSQSRFRFFIAGDVTDSLGWHNAS